MDGMTWGALAGQEPAASTAEPADGPEPVGIMKYRKHNQGPPCTYPDRPLGGYGCPQVVAMIRGEVKP